MTWSMDVYSNDEGKWIICSFVSGRNTMPLYILLPQAVNTVENFLYSVIWKWFFLHHMLIDWEKEVVFNSLREITDFERWTFVLFNGNKKWFFCVVSKVSLAPRSAFLKYIQNNQSCVKSCILYVVNQS